MSPIAALPPRAAPRPSRGPAHPPAEHRRSDPADRPMGGPGGRSPWRPSLLSLRRAVLAGGDRTEDRVVAPTPLVRPRDAPGRIRSGPHRDRAGAWAGRSNGEELSLPPSAAAARHIRAGPIAWAGLARRAYPHPTLPLRHVRRLPEPLQASHRRWLSEQQLPEPEQMRRRANRLASGLAAARTQPGGDRAATRHLAVPSSGGLSLGRRMPPGPSPVQAGESRGLW